jgi:hypothetical protein
LDPGQLSPRHRRWRLFVTLAAILIGSYIGWHYFVTTKAVDAAADLKTTAAKAAASAPIPVTVARVEKADFPVYLNGLGTAQPYRTVTVRSRVDGQIIKVAFKQGRMVKEGRLERTPMLYRMLRLESACHRRQIPGQIPLNAAREADALHRYRPGPLSVMITIGLIRTLSDSN